MWNIIFFNYNVLHATSIPHCNFSRFFLPILIFHVFKYEIL